MLSQAKKYLAYASECLRLAELADKPDVRYGLIELSNAWIEAALREVKHQAEKHRPPIRINYMARSGTVPYYYA